MPWTATETNRTQREYVCTWTSDGSGNVSDQSAFHIRGDVIGAYFTPDSGGTQPTNLYDFEIRDESGYNLLRNGADLSNAGTEYREALNYSGSADLIPIRGTGQKLTAVGTNCGASKGGVIRLLVQEVIP